MNPEQIEFFRTAMEVQFRHQFQKKPVFPFLPSLGVRDIFQGFGNDEVGFIGFLHLKWGRDGEGEKAWASIWYDTPEEGTEAQKEWFENAPFNRGKMMHSVHQHLKSLSTRLEIEEPEEERIILN